MYPQEKLPAVNRAANAGWDRPSRVRIAFTSTSLWATKLLVFSPEACTDLSLANLGGYRACCVLTEP